MLCVGGGTRDGEDLFFLAADLRLATAPTLAVDEKETFVAFCLGAIFNRELEGI